MEDEAFRILSSKVLFSVKVLSNIYVHLWFMTQSLWACKINSFVCFKHLLCLFDRYHRSSAPSPGGHRWRGKKLSKIYICMINGTFLPHCLRCSAQKMLKSRTRMQRLTEWSMLGLTIQERSYDMFDGDKCSKFSNDI